ncbi:hypothetical protein CFC21_004829 [Triticum aestivum]|uniref:NB-ARC domain-containing protein n=2 Tax=Triticum aestivum TaxID=4565 RepID=A0A3B5YQB1_WHEAT|nr:hypothetical protein CFC21_004829 [Triticum aestivum]
MAEGVVGLVVATLGAALATEAATFGWSLLRKEAAAIRDVFGKIRQSKAELESMQAYLHKAERFKDTDRTTDIFVGEIRGLAFQIEDVVDEFTYKLEDCKHGGFTGKIRSKVTTVWGMPGVGKTTLVAHVYNMLKLDFDAAAWVTMLKSYCLKERLKKIAAEFGIAVDVATSEMRGLAESIHNYLQGENFIVVLDDVWTPLVWSEIRNVFPTSNCTGRFVITSRKHEVSLLATRESAIHLEPLQAYQSWLLFCKEAFWNNDDKECPLELQELARKLVAKCQGLPIAIACIGRLLSWKQPTFAEWEDVYRGLDSQFMKDVIPDAHMILKVSLEDLLYDKKNCFLHCALCPEDHVLKRRKVMRQWITAGFIREKEENKTLEEVAEGYLAELVNRSLLQVVKRNHDGRLKHCRMHDVIRLLALNKAKEECFGKFYNSSASGALSVEGARRISVQGENIEQLSRSGATHLCVLHVLGRCINVDFLKPILTSSKFLSTLDLEGTHIKMLPNEVFDLFNLRYLGLRDTKIESLPEAVGRLQNLEVLDACESKLAYLPNNVVKLQKLRYLYAFTPGSPVNETGDGVKVPIGIQHMTALHSLQCIKATPEFLCEVGSLIELRTLSVCNIRSEHSAGLSNAITKMSHLVHLEIIAAAESDVLQLDGLRLPPTLSWLCLGGRLEKISMPQLFSSWSHLNGLTRLQLGFSNIDEQTFSCLFVYMVYALLG